MTSHLLRSATAALAAAALLSACSYIPPEAYQSRGNPEGLLDVSSEVVNLDISSPKAVDELGTWLQQDQPSRAEVYCPEQDANCSAALDVMDLYGVSYDIVPSSEFTVALVYERVLARDCNNRYIDHSVNPYHLNHPSFGCSIAVNMVQHVSDKQQFVRPNLTDLPDARKAIQVHQNYMVKRDITTSVQGASQSLINTLSTN